jgi:high-affinity iron transporter
MLQSFVITLREGVEAALIVGITLAYLNKVGRPDLRKSVFWGLGTAFLASIGLAFGISKANLNPELFEGYVMLLAAFFVVTMIVFMAKASKTLKGDIESKVGSLAGAGSKVGLFAFVFLMVLREGVETVLILAGLEFTTSQVLELLGTMAGVVVSILFGVMFVRGSVKINLRKFFKVTTVILVFVAIQLSISGLHELSENGVIPSSKQTMALIGPIVRNDIFFFVTIVALAALMVLFESKRRAPEAVAVDATRAEQRKAAWTAHRERLWTASVYVSSFVFIFLVTAQFIYAKNASALSPSLMADFVDGKATISLAGMANGDLRRYAAQVNGHDTRFLIYKKPTGEIATVMDACAICGNVGFYNSGGQGLTCKNCNAPINPQTVGEGGGCNPIPLKATISGDQVTVAVIDLSDGDSKIKQ